MTRKASKSATCSKCNSTDVAWAKSRKSGKFYLCEVFTDNEGDRVFDHRDFHSKYCGDPSKHAAQQVEILGKQPTTPAPVWDENEADNIALQISNQADAIARTLSIAKLAKAEPGIASLIAQVWERQGEDTLAAQMNGALGRVTTAD